MIRPRNYLAEMNDERFNKKIVVCDFCYCNK